MNSKDRNWIVPLPMERKHIHVIQRLKTAVHLEENIFFK